MPESLNSLAQAPESVVAFFGDRLALVERYGELLAGPAVVRGLIGPREVPRLWERHILNCAVVSEVVAEHAQVADVGSGAGLPGLVLAIARPDLTVTLIEPLQRRSSWLVEVVTELGLSEQVCVLALRAERAPLGAFDVVTSRAVAALDVLAGWSLPLLRPGGIMLAIKGQSAEQELQEASGALRELGAVEWESVHVGSKLLSTPTTVVRVRAGSVGTGRATSLIKRTSRRRGSR